MRKFGLIGYPLGHSFSAGYFADKFKAENITNCEYNNYPIKSIDKFPDLIKENVELKGLNVTIPYKEEVIPFLDDLHEGAREIGAVNCIKIVQQEKNTKLIGYNTDVFGFQYSLEPHLKSIHKKALILGTGGAAKAVAWVLKNWGIEYAYVSRTPKTEQDFSYPQLTEGVIKEHLLIVNTSPLGMHPKVNTCPDIPYESLSREHILYDLVYNPLETLFLKKGKEKGAVTVNGLLMLEQQANKAWEIWNED